MQRKKESLLLEPGAPLRVSVTIKIRTPACAGRASPPGTGVEPDCAFYVGERAAGYYEAQAKGEDAVYDYLE